MVRQEQDVNVTEIAKKKRWVAPEVTRLEFPKTAGSGTHSGFESGNLYVFTS